MQVMLVLHAAMHLHQHVQEHRKSTPSIGRHFRNKHSLALRDLKKNFSVLKKSTNKLDCLPYEMFFSMCSRTEFVQRFLNRLFFSIMIEISQMFSTLNHS